MPLLLALALAATQSIQPQTVSYNDLKTPAGAMVDGVHTLRLEARLGDWNPDGSSGTPRRVAAFAEVGGPLQNPGPLLRVPVGTKVHVSIRNGLDTRLWLYGLGEKRGMAADSFAIEPGDTRDVRFTASEVGTFWYAGRTAPVPLFERFDLDSQLNGAIVVDAPGARANDRIFVISWYGDLDSTTVGGLAEGGGIYINGLAWPNTERVQATQGDTLTFRWVNVTDAPHPMHLHGFYFDILGSGDGTSFTTFAPDQQQQAVTEIVHAGHAMTAAWTPVRPGNWIFHCHFAGHITSDFGLNQDRRYPEKQHAAHAGAQTHDDGHDKHYMYGLVLGIEVAPKGALKASSAEPRPIRLLLRSKPNVYGEYSGYAYVLGGSEAERDAQAMPVPGPVLVLKKDQPVAITLINHTHEAAAVHWHGIELESFPDGVPGWSGYLKELLPSIPPGDSLTVRFTPPRAGTFMYHSHSNEMQQIGSGLYGAIIVVDEGQSWDPETDRILLLSDAGPVVNLIKGPFPRAMLNGETAPAPIDLNAGTRYRFRVINIRAEHRGMLSLLDGERPVEWKMIARDGADLPASQVKLVPVQLISAPGQIWDFEYTPARAGELTLRFGYPPMYPEKRYGKPTDVIVRVK